MEFREHGEGGIGEELVLHLQLAAGSISGALYEEQRRGFERKRVTRHPPPVDRLQNYKRLG